MARSKEKLSKHFLRLREGDFDALNNAYPSIGPSPVIRQLVSAHVDHLLAEAEARVPGNLPSLSLEIEDLSQDERHSPPAGD